MRGTLLCLRTKCNQAVSLLSEQCAGELDVLHRALQRFEQGLTSLCRNPNFSLHFGTANRNLPLALHNLFL